MNGLLSRSKARLSPSTSPSLTNALLASSSHRGCCLILTSARWSRRSLACRPSPDVEGPSRRAERLFLLEPTGLLPPPPLVLCVRRRMHRCEPPLFVIEGPSARVGEDPRTHPSWASHLNPSIGTVAAAARTARAARSPTGTTASIAMNWPGGWPRPITGRRRPSSCATASHTHWLAPAERTISPESAGQGEGGWRQSHGKVGGVRWIFKYWWWPNVGFNC